jgi:hypothetical protein
MNKMNSKLIVPAVLVGLSGLTLLGVRSLIAAAFTVVASVNGNNETAMLNAGQDIAIAVFLITFSVFAAFRVLYAQRQKAHMASQ